MSCGSPRKFAACGARLASVNCTTSLTSGKGRMNLLNRKTMHPALSRARSWHVAFAASVAITACGGKTRQDGNPQEPSTGEVAALGGAGALSSGTQSDGANGSGGAQSGGANGSGGVTAQTGGATGDAGSGNGPAHCDLTDLLDAVRWSAVGNSPDYCFVSEDPAAIPTQPWGAIILDGDGRVVTATGGAQFIVGKLTNERWPCYAGTTFLYWCTSFE